MTGGNYRPLTGIWVRVLFGIGVSILLLAASASRVDLDLLAKASGTISATSLVVAGSISVLEVSVRALRWGILLRPFAKVTFQRSLAYLTIGHLANAVLPARLGDFTRALLAGPGLRISRFSVLGTIAVERVADAAVLGCAIGVGVLVGFTAMADTLIGLLLISCAIGVAIGLGWLLLNQAAVATTRQGRFVRMHAGRFLAGARSLKHPMNLGLVMFLTFASFALAVAIISVVAASVGLSLPVWESAIVIGAATLSTAIPSGPASIGTYEFVGMSTMTAMGYPPAASLLCVALVHLVALLPASVMGLVATWSMGLRLPRMVPVAADQTVLHDIG